MQVGIIASAVLHALAQTSTVAKVESTGVYIGIKRCSSEDVRTAIMLHNYVRQENPKRRENPVPSSVISVYKSSDGFETQAWTV